MLLLNFENLSRTRTTVMQFNNVKGRKFMSFTKEEFEGFIKISDQIKHEIVQLEKRT